jgi:hypothetical protein
LDGDGVRGGNIGVEGKGVIGESTRKVFEVGIGGELENARIYGKRGVALYKEDL